MHLFHERLREAIKNANLSQCALAKKLNVSQHTIWKWTHEQLPSLERFRQLCDILNANPAYLLGLVD